MRRAAATVLLTLSLGLIAGSVLAADIFPVGLNEGRRIILHGSAANVVVANPAVADVTMVDGHSIIILGRGYGATAIMVLDHSGRVLFDGHVRVSPPEQGLVTIHHGAESADVYCIATRCAPATPAAVAQGSGGDGGGASAGGATAAPSTPGT
jgi:hypothetical protein